MSARILLFGVALTCAAPAAGQTLPPPAAPSAADPAVIDVTSLTYQVHNFEMLLQNAADHGGKEFMTKAATVVPPNVQLLVLTDPEVHGYPLPTGGFIFSVQVPPVMQSVVSTWVSLRRRDAGAQPASTGDAPGRVAANALPEPDPVKPPPAAAAFNPDRVYTLALRDAFIEAMLDFPSALPLKDQDWITVAFSNAAGPIPPALYSDNRTMILSLKGEYLIQFRKGAITREQTRNLVEIRRF